MCGIAGYWDPILDISQAEGSHRLDRMMQTIVHRGPDDAGKWIDSSAGVGFAHRRLSILDLSAAGHQPMISPCGRFALTYNGEIYNHLQLRQALESEGGNFDWQGHSDTETLLAALRHWGTERTLRRLNGMFAFALWDRADEKLVLARDRMGEKPLYYGSAGNAFIFGSELKALVAHPEWEGRIDRDALALFMRHNYVPAPWSIYKGISKLLPAHYLVVSDRGKSRSEPSCYWNLSEIAETGTSEPAGDEAEMVESLDQILRNSIRLRMAADVPLGAFLSGGYDSSTVVALMQAQSAAPIQTFSIGFHEAQYNEANHAKAVAEHLGTDHHEMYVRPEQALAVVPRLPEIWDEPFADSSQIPTFLVSELARRYVKVSLSGDGGDELFCGYSRYALGHSIWSKIRMFPAPARRVLAAAVARAPGRQLDRAMRMLPPRLRLPNLEDRLPKLAQVLAHRDGGAFYRSLISHWKQPDEVVLGSSEPRNVLNRPESWPALSGLREQMMYLDAMTYLPDDILAKVDRASMAVSLEARVPLLDHRLVEFAWKVPMGYKYRNGQGKWILRQVLYRYVPPALLDRPKMGFGVPIDSWLRGPLRDWAEQLLGERRLVDEGFFDPAPVRRMWSEHLAGKHRWHYHLWNVLMFQAWLESQTCSSSDARAPRYVAAAVDS